MQLEGWQLLIEEDLLAKGHLLLFEFASYPSPKLTFCPKREVSVNIGLGEG